MTFWDEFAHDPRSPENAHLRASDRDRDVVSALLSTAYADGRLSRDEFSERSDQLTATKTLGEIPALVADLISANARQVMRPDELRAEAERRYRSDRREALTYLGPAIICWVIWAAVLIGGHGTAFPWPIFVTLGTGMPFLRLLLNPEDHIVSRQRSLEKKQARALNPPPPKDKSLGGRTTPPNGADAQPS